MLTPAANYEISRISKTILLVWLHRLLYFRNVRHLRHQMTFFF